MSWLICQPEEGREVAVRLVKTLQEANIEIHFPQRDLHIRSIGSNAGGPEPQTDLFSLLLVVQ